LYIQFQINGDWMVADELRRMDSTRIDEAEERALDDALCLVRRHPKGKQLGIVEATRAAARHVARHPAMIDEARRFLAVCADLCADLDLSGLGA
jgi:hypothetical protein